MRYGRTPPPPDVREIRHLTVLPVWHATEPSAASVLGCGRTMAYEKCDSGEIPTIQLGRKRVVPVRALLRLLGADDANDDGGAA